MTRHSETDAALTRSLTTWTSLLVKGLPLISRWRVAPQLFTSAPANFLTRISRSVRGRWQALTVRTRSWTLALLCERRFCMAATQLRALQRVRLCQHST